MRRTVTLLVLAGLVSAVLVAPVAAAPPAATVSKPLVEGLAGPLGLAVGAKGTIYVSQAFAGMLTAVHRKGGAEDIAFAPEPGTSISGVAARGRGSVVFTVAGEGEGEGDYTGLIQRVLPNGKTKTLGDTATHEETANPDAGNSYGFQGLDDECAALVPAEVGGGYPYPGLVDSNSYAVEFMRGGWMAVADAGGNSIVRVNRNGSVRTLAVLPPLPAVVTADVAAMFGLPDCAIGAVYNFEPVPTDVELGRDGLLYVSALPGGPEDDSLGARGKVFTVDPKTGAVTEIASGFLGATDLAVAPDGTVYVAELFGNRISKVVGGAPELVVELNEPAAIEWSKGKLYATMNAFGNGAVVIVRP